jgi:hypothetical protein
MVQSFGVSIFLHLIVSCQKKEYGCTRTLSFQILEACSCCAVVVVLCVLALFFVFPCNKFDGELYWLMSNIHLFACAGEETLPKDVSCPLNCWKLLVQCIMIREFRSGRQEKKAWFCCGGLSVSGKHYTAKELGRVPPIILNTMRYKRY